MSRLTLWFSFLSFTLSASSFAQKEVTLMIYVDQSQSMGSEARALSELTSVITQRLEKTCGKYRIGVSGLSYADGALRTPKMEGAPKFITEKHGHVGIDLLRKRILSLAASDYLTRERTYSTIVESFKREKSELLNSEFVATLLLSDATPAFEQYSATKALEEIYKIVPKYQFMSFGVIPNFHHKDISCSVDEVPVSVASLTDEQLIQPYQFFRQSGGFVGNFCSDDLKKQIDEFLSLVISNAECQQLM